MSIAAYPLAWPTGWKRTPALRRADGRFSTRPWSTKRTGQQPLSVSDGVNRVLKELEKLSIARDDVVISTNVQTRLDGLPRSGLKEPDDPGAAVYWRQANCAARCIAIDRYSTVADNLAAVAATLDAMRAIERHGGASILERAFTGFTALPAPGAHRTCWEVLDLHAGASADEIRLAYRKLASEHHPDKGGSAARMTEINQAREQALEKAGIK